jgi:hypothetical protein
MFDNLGALAPTPTNPSAFRTSELSILSRAEWLGRKVAVVSVSAANGAHTLAVLVVEDDFFVRYDIAAEQPDMPVVYISGELINPEHCVPGSVFVGKPYQHIDILSACRRLHNR